MRLWGPGLAALAAVVASPALAERLATDAEFAVPDGHYYPDRAQRMSIEGWARLRCTAHEAGVVGECALVGETPLDFGFGDALLKVSRVARLRSPAQPGDVVYLYLEFRVPDGEAEPVGRSVTPPPRATIEAARPALAEPIGMALVNCEALLKGTGPLTRCRALAEAPSIDGYGAAGAALAERAYGSVLPALSGRMNIVIPPGEGPHGPSSYGTEDYELEIAGDASALPPGPTEPVSLSCAISADGRLRNCRPDGVKASQEATAAAIARSTHLRFSRRITFVINWGQ